MREPGGQRARSGRCGRVSTAVSQSPDGGTVHDPSGPAPPGRAASPDPPAAVRRPIAENAAGSRSGGSARPRTRRKGWNDPTTDCRTKRSLPERDISSTRRIGTTLEGEDRRTDLRHAVPANDHRHAGDTDASPLPAPQDDVEAQAGSPLVAQQGNGHVAPVQLTAESFSVVVHPPRGGKLERQRRSVLGWSSDGSGLHVHVRSGRAPTTRLRESMVAAGADLGG